MMLLMLLQILLLLFQIRNRESNIKVTEWVIKKEHRGYIVGCLIVPKDSGYSNYVFLVKKNIASNAYIHYNLFQDARFI